LHNSLAGGNCPQAGIAAALVPPPALDADAPPDADAPLEAAPLLALDPPPDP
jgi:hypothetical protein